MAFVSNPFNWGTPQDTIITYSLDSSSKKIAFGFTPITNGSITKVRLFLWDIDGTPPTYDAGIQSDSGGSPDGSYLSSDTFTPDNDGAWTITISSQDLIADTKYWVVVQHNSGTINTSNDITFGLLGPVDVDESRYPYGNYPEGNLEVKTSSGAGWNSYYGIPVFMVDNDSNYYVGQPYVDFALGRVYEDRYRGELFAFAENKTISEVSAYLQKFGSVNDCLYKIIRYSDGETLRSGTLASSGDIPTIPTAATKFTASLSSPLTLLAGTYYRFIVYTTGGDASNFIDMMGYVTDEDIDTSVVDYTYGGDNSIACTSDNAGSSWNDTNDEYDFWFDFTEGFISPLPTHFNP